MAKEIAPGIEPQAEGDGKALICCVGRAAMTPELDKRIVEMSKRIEARVAAGEPLLKAIGIEPQAEGDGKALICCVGNKRL